MANQKDSFSGENHLISRVELLSRDYFIDRKNFIPNILRDKAVMEVVHDLTPECVRDFLSSYEIDGKEIEGIREGYGSIQASLKERGSSDINYTIFFVQPGFKYVEPQGIQFRGFELLESVLSKERRYSFPKEFPKLRP